MLKTPTDEKMDSIKGEMGNVNGEVETKNKQKEML